MLISSHPRDQMFYFETCWAPHPIFWYSISISTITLDILLFGPSNVPQVSVLLSILSYFVARSTLWMQQRRVYFSFVKLPFKFKKEFVLASAIL